MHPKVWPENGNCRRSAFIFPLMYLDRKYGKERQIVMEVSRVIAAVGAVLLVFRAFGKNP
jgi:hypothetical protein